MYGKMDKKAIYFSSDAIIAVIVLFLAMIIFSFSIPNQRYETKISSDLINVLSNLKIGELNNSYTQNLIDQGKITHLNKSLLEQIGEFYITNISLAKEFCEEIFETINFYDNIGIWYNNHLIYSFNSSPISDAKNIDVDSQFITGLREGDDVTGFSARAFLESNMKTKYFYFGGYVGDGNISIKINYNGQIDAITMEITTNDYFSVYINDIFSGFYEGSETDHQPKIYDISSYKANFNEGENIIKLVANQTNLYISGGYFKINYKEEEIIISEDSKRYYFPGIEGLINIYDGVFIPTELNSIEIFLHYESNFDIFLNIGNVTVYKGNSTHDGEQITLTNTELQEILNYNLLTNKTTPIRLALDNVSYELEEYINVDVVSVTDLSGSMGWCSEYYTCSYNCLIGGAKSCEIVRDCTGNICGGFCWGSSGHSESCPDAEPTIYYAKEANNIMIDGILNYSGNRVGLVGYRGGPIPPEDYHHISNDSESLKELSNSWEAGGWTSTCHGILKGIELFEELEEDPSKMRAMIVMSDGEINHDCEGNHNRALAEQAAVDMACYAYEEHNITVHVVGFGEEALEYEYVLLDIAECGRGNYYYGDATDIIELYEQIAKDIIEAAYEKQTMITIGEIHTILHPDSYIEFNYNQITRPYGLILNIEENFYNISKGNFTIPEDSTLIDANIFSYSGAYWTSLAIINDTTFFNLSEYQKEYINLGDPYFIGIPIELIDSENENNVIVKKSLSHTNQTYGSEFNKIIYRVVKEFVSYSPIVSRSEGCKWFIEFEDSSNITATVPKDYTGDNECNYKTKEGVDFYDAMQLAVINLLDKLDFNDNGLINIKFKEQDLNIGSNEIIGIPYTESMEVQIRRWD